MIEIVVSKAPVKPTRATRNTQPATATAATGLAAAPRRRIKVTPLVPTVPEPEPTPAPAVEEKAEKKTPTRSKKEKSAVEAKITTASRTKRKAAAAKLDEPTQVGDKEPELKKRGRTRAAKTEEEPVKSTSKPTSAAPKSRGRPKKEVAADPVEEEKPAPVTTRQTRARVGSVTAPVAAESTVSVVVPPKKKVTFETLPGDDDDEKENKRPKTMAKGKIAKISTKKSEPPATGMRARPIRKPASTRTTKSTRGASAKTTTPPAEEMEVDESEKKMPRALTPKKITQVAKVLPIDSDEEEEDELSSAKTPVRDLSISPRRGLTPSAVRPLSPVKTLDFATALKPASPEKLGLSAALGLLSPARRLPASPLKESLKESPRRAPEGVTIFRAQMPESYNSALAALSPAKNQSVLQQSPKRGLADNIVFPPSAMKSRATPLKNSFLASPARRLFSASKPKTLARLSPSPKKWFEKENTTPLAEVDEIDDTAHSEFEITSYFRSSVSPQRSTRVYRLSEDELAQELGAEVNFDESVLNVRSPMKVDKAKPIVADAPASSAMSDLEEVEEQQENEVEMETPAESVEDNVSHEDNDETIMENASETGESSELQEASNGVSLAKISTAESVQVQQAGEKSPRKARISNALFTRLRQMEEESEDELAGDQTPDNRMLKPSFRPSMSAANIRSRLSNGVVPPSASGDFGFTPLTAQVRGWRAGSPEKKTPAPATRLPGLFSPLARMHVEGSVELNRPDTPGSKRKSLASRISLAPSMAESPMRPDYFADGMAAQNFEDQVEEGPELAPEQHEDLHDVAAQDMAEPASSEVATAGNAEATKDAADSAELTTDIVNFTNASDTAMVDFKALADEAEELAADEAYHDEVGCAVLEDVQEEDSILSETSADRHEQDHMGKIEQDEEATDERLPAPIEDEDSMLSTSSGSFGDENAGPVALTVDTIILGQEPEVPAIDRTADVEVEEDVDEGHEGENLHFQESHDKQSAESLLEKTAASIEVSPFKSVSASVPKMDAMDFSVTPVRRDLALPRQIHTVVSKVPLAPEGAVGAVSPIKMPRKRALSMSASTPQGVKRRSFGLDQFLVSTVNDALSTPRAASLSPQRRVRSAAPSPANSHMSGLSTPGQFSFSIEDFGDSTLDGIEMLEDELMSDELEGSMVEEDQSMLTTGSGFFKTPIAPAKRAGDIPGTVRLNASATPHYAMSTKSTKSRTEATPRMTPSKSKTHSTTLKSKLAAKTPQSSRTPLQAVGRGVLHGAVIHTDIHTSEGADASAFYVEILTSMGAKVVKDWRWNPRASVARVEDENPEINTNPGITHVVYKDGGKRTLEKVRSAHGLVLCVGVGWVLGCMRESKWLDESAYAADQSILPRGGSRRRKSMEPRMLVNDHGSLSAKPERRNRSVSMSVELALRNEDLKSELINTPVRGNEIFEQQHPLNSALGDETEISSTYNSPTAATVGGGGDTANVALLLAQQDVRRTPGSAISHHKYLPTTTEVETPTSLNVDYDPRTAATPLTPYLVAKGKDLIQRSAPAKQVQKGIFDNDEDEEDSLLVTKQEQMEKEKGRKFQVKGNKGYEGRRKTLGVPGVEGRFKPVVGSPLRKE